MRTYSGSGHAYLVCPALVKLDARHGRHSTKAPRCARGLPCQHKHEHETFLSDPEGHTVNDFHWIAGCRPPTPEEWPSCDLCGEPLKWADLDDPLGEKHLGPEAG